MNILLLQWGLISFVLGIVLSLPLAAVYYQNSPQWAKIFTNPRKLKSAHLDFFMQALAIGFVYLLEWAVKSDFPLYVVIPLVFGTICNPLLLLLEATPLYHSGLTAIVYRFLKATSPVSLLFAWFAIALFFLPMYLMILLSVIVLIGLLLILNWWNHYRRFW